jgi:hypothetical protein
MEKLDTDRLVWRDDEMAILRSDAAKKWQG